MKAFAVLVENSADAREGVLLIDDIELLPAGAVAKLLEAGTYDALNDRTWSAGGGAGNEYRDGVWKYAFGSPHLRAGFSLLGSPQRLRLTVDSDGSGHGVERSPRLALPGLHEGDRQAHQEGRDGLRGPAR